MTCFLLQKIFCGLFYSFPPGTHNAGFQVLSTHLQGTSGHELQWCYGVHLSGAAIARRLVLVLAPDTGGRGQDEGKGLGTIKP